MVQALLEQKIAHTNGEIQYKQKFAQANGKFCASDSFTYKILWQK
jgi:hypothetical protein